MLIELYIKEDPFDHLMGNNSYKPYNFRIKAGNVQMVDCCITTIYVNLFLGRPGSGGAAGRSGQPGAPGQPGKMRCI